MYFGWELEFEASNRFTESLEDIAKEIKQRYKWLWVKRDGALHNGFEIISHPATVQWHRNNQRNVDELVRFLKSKEMFVSSLFGTGEGGAVHLHMNRSWFDNDEQVLEYENQVLKLLDYNRFAFTTSPYCELKKNPDLFGGRRYFAVTMNLSIHPNHRTVEVRYFRDDQTISDLVAALAHCARFAKYGQENK